MENKEMINVTRSSMPPLEEYVEEIRGLWGSHWLTNMGEKHRALEAQLKEYLSAPQLVLYTNGHLGLETALQAMGLSGEVITTPFTFISTTHAITRSGLTPVFADIEPEHYTLDAAAIEPLITERTTAIVPVHVYGALCDVDAIDAIAKKHGLKVLYDAAHAFGVRKNGVGAATFGDAAMFSFHATKVFNTIEGGAVACKDEALANAMNRLKNYGIVGAEEVDRVGGNAKMSEFQAAMGLCNLRHLGQELEGRQAVCQRYTQRLGEAKGLRLAAPQPGVQSNHAYFPVLFDAEAFGASRDEVYQRLVQNGVQPRKYFYPLTSAMACYPGHNPPAETPVAHRVASQVLTLPLYGELPLADVDRICDIVLGK